MPQRGIVYQPRVARRVTLGPGPQVHTPNPNGVASSDLRNPLGVGEFCAYAPRPRVGRPSPANPGLIYDAPLGHGMLLSDPARALRTQGAPPEGRLH